MPALMQPECHMAAARTATLRTTPQVVPSKRTCSSELAQRRQLLCLKPGLLRWGLVRQCLLPHFDVPALRRRSRRQREQYHLPVRKKDAHSERSRTECAESPQ